MIPFFFGTSDYQLFGVYHQPKINTPHSRSIVICTPIAHEYLRSYRIIRKLAEQLSNNGNHVLRFDWYGHGDSKGKFNECRKHFWIQNVITAVDELLNYSGHNSISIIGLRLGADLALIASENFKNVDNLVLWDPILDGTKWINDLKELHFVCDFFKGRENHDYIERIGFPYTADLINDIANINLCENIKSKCESIEIFSEKINFYRFHKDFCSIINSDSDTSKSGTILNHSIK